MVWAKTVLRKKTFLLLFLLAFCLSCAGRSPGFSSGPSGDFEARGQALAYYRFALSGLYLERGDFRRAAEELAKAELADPGSSEIKYRLGFVYMILDMRGRAVEKFDESIRLDPSNPSPRKDLGRVYLARSDDASRRKGRESLLAAAELDPGDGEIYLLLSAGELRSGNLSSAREYAEKSLSISSTDVRGHFYLGNISARENDLGAAVGHYKRALDIHPRYYPAFLGLVETLERAKRTSEAIDYYEDAIRKFSPYRDIFISYGNMLYRNRRFEGAIEQYGNAEIMDPVNLEIKYRMGLLYLESERYAEAAEKFAVVLKRAPGNAAAKYYAAVARTELGDYPGSAKLLAAIPEGSEFHVNALVHRAYVHELEGSAEKAVGILEGLYEKDPDDARLVKSLGSLYGRLGRQEDSISMYGGYLDRHPADESVAYSLGVSYYHGGRVSEAISVMEDIIEKNPENFDAMNFVGYTYAERGEKLDYAEGLIRKAMEFAPDRGYIIDSLGWVYYQKGDFATAVEYLLRAVDASPRAPEIMEHLGDAYVGVGKTELAAEKYERALSILDSKKLLTPEDEKVRRRLLEKVKGPGSDEA